MVDKNSEYYKYYEWVLKHFKYAHLREPSNGFMDKNFWLKFGKHRDKHPWKILEDDPNYYIWAWKNVRHKMPKLLKDFIINFNKDIEILAEKKNLEEKNIFK